MDPDCAVITPTDPTPVSSRATGLTMINKRIMPYCITMLCGNVVCMMGAQSGFAGYYSAINPQLQVDLLNTTATPLRFVTGEQASCARATPCCSLRMPLPVAQLWGTSACLCVATVIGRDHALVLNQMHQLP